VLYNYAVDKIVATGSIIKEDLEKKLGCRKVVVISGGVDSNKFKILARLVEKRIRTEFKHRN